MTRSDNISFANSMRKLLESRLTAKGWTRYRLAKEYGARREGKEIDEIRASRYNSIVSRCLTEPDKINVSTLIDIAQCLDVSLLARATEEVTLT